MQSEVSIAKQLSGPECVEACLNAVRNALAQDDRFSTHMAYPGFRAVIDFHFFPHQSYIPEVERVVKVTGGELGKELEVVDVAVELPVRPPNQVREEAGMPQPVLVTDQNGQSHEEWKKVASKPPSQKFPHNKVKGA